MQNCRRFRLLICAGLLTAALSGCGGSSSKDHIPSTVSIFYEHSVLFRNHTTFTMGYNGFGQLGDGTLKTREIAVPVPGMVNMTKAVGGVAHTMVTDGTKVWAWGYNLYGQLGNSTALTTYPDAFKSSPVPVTFPNTVTTVTDIAAGAYHSLAVGNDALYAWGDNANRQLGDSTIIKKTVPVEIKRGHADEDLTALKTVQVAAGGYHSLALMGDGSVYAWGDNRKGQAGHVVLDTYSSAISSPRKVLGLPGNGGAITKIAASSRTSYALEEKVDGNGVLTQTLWGWGYNGYKDATDPTNPKKTTGGELAQDPAVLQQTAVPVAVLSIAATDDNVIKKIATGINHLLLLMGPRGSDAGNFVQAVGYNDKAQLGNSQRPSLTSKDTSLSSFEFVYALNTAGTGTLTGVTDIAAFGTSSFALVNGTWYAWGDNGNGQVGNKVATDTITYFQLPVTVKFQ
ncbi:RCC1 domain-containing protein [Geomonas anaerohicana]|uniref:Chromosome condensation regulator RCC1 n=1 Tax=Geomonas anaerohicana TaxID=2798583 RepID=A0ABS0YHU1_9BACT|nr:chromosome condensation regulator RCC1 [Geomonas anaerohicana]MBJ6751903.1 chromosome condensation regulator RCC1 [Geomonas anaerohicana]